MIYTGCVYYIADALRVREIRTYYTRVGEVVFIMFRVYLKGARAAANFSGLYISRGA